MIDHERARRKERICAAFSAAVPLYEREARAQDIVAATLAERVLAGPVPDRPRVLEIGCGTGLLTRRLRPRLAGDWLVTDLSAAMVAAVAEGPGRGARCRVMDGEAPDVAPASVDLIVSSLAIQWFADPLAGLAGLARCLAPGGRMVATLPGQGSFAEWRGALAAAGGGEAGTPPLPDTADLAGALAALGQVQVIAEPVVMRYADGQSFLRGLKSIGAATPARGHRPVAVGVMRRALAALGAPCAVTYRILTVDFMAERG
jgi:malonyl-CoA O-methyltransferase